ncbi:MAG: outer membrane protein TolC [Zhongshania aliphaticivorans]|jgi:outer membrane protein TolC|uniref:TolC family protein n=2 Tax=Zhongshania aliphaticivorans TaxID=1470434 RepID=UPI0039E284F7|tara:strand:- start:804 stop:2078 length:1275 start_codon:yes stop_codon:yes gene_type:complete
MGSANRRRHQVALASLCLLISGAAVGLSLDRAINLAQANDPWLHGSQLRESALAAEAISASTLPDPILSFGAANLPTDSFDFRQEGMTQASIGITQRLPRGNSRELMGKQKRQLGQQQAMLRADRQAKVAATVSQLWLEGYRAEQSMALIERTRPLFEQLLTLSRSNYGAGLARAGQQDIISAELALSRLDDRLLMLQQQRDTARDQLSEWLGTEAITAFSTDTFRDIRIRDIKDRRLASALQAHPAIRAIEQTIAVAQSDVALRQEQYKAEWAVNAKYAHRADDPLGNDRADLFSIGVSVDLPLFTAKRQDQNLSAAQARAEANRTDKALLLRKMMANLKTQFNRLQGIDERLTLYNSRLLREARKQVSVNLNAYQNDKGDFREVIQAQIDALNVDIDALNLRIDRQKTSVNIAYLLAGEHHE